MSTPNFETVDKMAELKDRKDTLVVQKREVEGKLAAIRNVIRTSGLMPRAKYRQCCESQTAHLNKLREIESGIAMVCSEIRQASDDSYKANVIRKSEASAAKKDDVASMVIPVLRPSIEWKRECVDELCDLRSSYQDFAADHTRMSSKRQMAAEFVTKLNPIIRRFLKD